MPPQLPDLIDANASQSGAILSAVLVFCITYSVGFCVRMLLALVIWRPIKFSSSLSSHPLADLVLGLAWTPIIILGIGQIPFSLWSCPWRWIGFSCLLFAAIQIAIGLRQITSKVEFSLPALLGWVVLASYLIILTLPAMRPPIQYDVLEYHLGVVRHSILTGSITPIPRVFYSAQPLATEMLYTLGALIERTIWGFASGWVQWGLVVLLAILLAGLLSQLGIPQSYSPWLVLMLLTHPVLSKLALDRMTDLTGALFLVGGLTFLWGNNSKEKSAANLHMRLLCAGMMAGGAIATKWTNAGTTALILIGIGLYESRRVPRQCFALLIGLGLVIAPWMGWLAVRTGNPLAPFAAQWFPTVDWNAARLDFLLKTHGLVSPLNPQYWASLYRRTSSLALGPPVAFITLVLLIAIWRIRARSVGATAPDSPLPTNLIRATFLLILSFVSILLWGRLTLAQDRFLAPVMTAQIIALGLAISSACAIFSRAARCVPLLFLMILPYAYLATNPLRDLWSVRHLTHDQYLDTMMGGTAGFFRAINSADPTVGTLLIGEARTYYLTGDVAASSVFDRSPAEEIVKYASEPWEFRNKLQEAGYNYLAVNEFEIARLLDFHPPPILQRDANFMALRERGREGYSEIVEDYEGYVEFGPEPLDEVARTRYVAFVKMLRAQAMRSPASGSPALWIAPLK